MGDTDLTLKGLIPNLSAKTTYHDWFPLDSTEALKNKLMECITKVRLALIAADPAAKVQSIELAQAARTEGIPIETSPNVTGPSGEP